MRVFRISLLSLAGLCLLAASADAKDPAKPIDPTDFMVPTLDGGGGLFRIHTAEAGRQFDIRVGLHFEFFTRDRFIVDNWANCDNRCPDETNQRVQGAVTIGFTPIKYLEVFSALYSSANRNDRNHQPLGLCRKAIDNSLDSIGIVPGRNLVRNPTSGVEVEGLADAGNRHSSGFDNIQ